MEPVIFWVGGFALIIILTLTVASYRVMDKENTELKQQLLLQGSASEAHYRSQLSFYLKEVNRLSEQEAANFNLAQELKNELDALKSQQQSKSVRLGQLSEAIMPFHPSFKYDPKKLVPMFRPIDYVFFGDDEIVFVELKLGTSQLTQKQKNIRRLIEEGKVRFDLIEATESGIKSKESHGKKANA